MREETIQEPIIPTYWKMSQKPHWMKPQNVLVLEVLVYEKETTYPEARVGGEFTRKRSWVWKHLDKLSNIIYRCNLWNVVLSIKGCNTNNMNIHVRTRHPTVYKTEMEKKKDASDIEVANEVTAKDSLMIVDDGIKELDESSSEMISKHRRSWVWAYFKLVSSTLAECRLCNRTICHGGNATGNMNRHLKMLHHKTGDADDTSWVGKVFELTDHVFYLCKISQFKCMKHDDVEKNIACILLRLF